MTLTGAGVLLLSHREMGVVYSTLFMLRADPSTFLRMWCCCRMMWVRGELSQTAILYALSCLHVHLANIAMKHKMRQTFLTNRLIALWWRLFAIFGGVIRAFMQLPCVYDFVRVLLHLRVVFGANCL